MISGWREETSRGIRSPGNYKRVFTRTLVPYLSFSSSVKVQTQSHSVPQQLLQAIELSSLLHISTIFELPFCLDIRPVKTVVFVKNPCFTSTRPLLPPDLHTRAQPSFPRNLCPD